MYDRLRKFIGQGLVVAENPLHALQRRLIQPAFRATRIASYMAEMGELTAALADSWRDGQRVEVDQALAELAGTVVARCQIGRAHV